MMLQDNPGIVSWVIEYQTRDRVFTQVHDRTGPPWFYVGWLPLAIFPWFFLIPAILRAPLAELRRDELWRDHPMPGYPDRITTGFDLGGALLWGLTGRMTRELLSRLGG